MIQRMVAIWCLVPLPLLNPTWTSGSSWFMYCWSLVWRFLRITLVVCEMNAIVQQFENSLALPFFWIRMKTDLFQSCGHYWVFQICWHTECRTFTASSSRIWNSSAEISSPPLALFLVMLRNSWAYVKIGGKCIQKMSEESNRHFLLGGSISSSSSLGWLRF